MVNKRPVFIVCRLDINSDMSINTGIKLHVIAASLRFSFCFYLRVVIDVWFALIDCTAFASGIISAIYRVFQKKCTKFNAP